MKNYILIIISLVFIQCYSNSEINPNNSMPSDLEKEINDFLEKRNSTNQLEYVQYCLKKEKDSKILTLKISGQNSIEITKGIVNESKSTIQKFEFNNNEERANYLNDFLENAIKNGYLEEKIRPLIFVQILYEDDENKGIFDEYKQFNTKLDHLFYDKNIGEFAASDLGYGYNFLYNVWDEITAEKEIISYLKKINISHRTIVAKRINQTPDNWDYEVIHPKGFKGKFYSY